MARSAEVLLACIGLAVAASAAAGTPAFLAAAPAAAPAWFEAGRALPLTLTVRGSLDRESAWSRLGIRYSLERFGSLHLRREFSASAGGPWRETSLGWISAPTRGWRASVFLATPAPGEGRRPAIDVGLSRTF